MKLFDLMFYGFYCLVIKKPNDQSHVRAIMLQAITLVNLLLDVVLLAILLSPYTLNLKMFYLFVIVIITVNVVINKIEYKYFINNAKYKLVILKFDNLYSEKQKRNLGLFSLLLILFSTGLFIYVGISLGKEMNAV